MYVNLIYDENECNSRVKSEEITVVEDEALHWSTTSKLGGIDGNPTPGGTRKEYCTRTRKLTEGGQLGMSVLCLGTRR